METGIEARLWTLKELQDWTKVQMENCESKEDNWIVIGNTTNHNYPIGTEVKILDTLYDDEIDVTYYCVDKEEDHWHVYRKDLENRKHLDTSRYNAFKEMYDKIEELITKTANSPANV